MNRRPRDNNRQERLIRRRVEDPVATPFTNSQMENEIITPVKAYPIDYSLYFEDVNTGFRINQLEKELSEIRNKIKHFSNYMNVFDVPEGITRLEYLEILRRRRDSIKNELNEYYTEINNIENFRRLRSIGNEVPTYPGGKKKRKTTRKKPRKINKKTIKNKSNKKN